MYLNNAINGENISLKWKEFRYLVKDPGVKKREWEDKKDREKGRE